MRPNAVSPSRVPWIAVLMCAGALISVTNRTAAAVPGAGQSVGRCAPYGRHAGPEAGALFFLGDLRYEAGSVPVSIAYGRFDADDRLDLVTANSEGQSFTALLQTRDGAFESLAEVLLGATPAWIAAGDVSGDGFDDIALVLGDAATLIVLTSDGTGGFREEGRYQTGASPRCVLLADFDADGNLDVACTNGEGNTVSVFRNRGPGVPGARFSAPVQFAAGTDPGQLVAGDFTGDGRMDLAIANGSELCVSVLPGDATGGFGAAIRTALAWGPGALAASDLDRDGDLDLAATGWGPTYVLTNDGTGAFTERQRLDTFLGSRGVAIADLDGDGVEELIAAIHDDATNIHYDFSFVAVFVQRGTAYRLQTNHSVGPLPIQVVAADLEGDGDLDLVTAHAWKDRLPRTPRPEVSVIENIGRGRLASVTMRVFADWSTVPNRDYPTGLFPLPLPGRKLPDLLMATVRGAQRFDNLGDGRFADPVPVMDVEPVELRDLTGDGVLDVIASSWTDTFWVHVGDAAGSFTRRQESVGHRYLASVRTRPRALPDLLVWRYQPVGDEDQPVTASVLPNLGGGRFGGPRLLEGVTYSPRDRAFSGADLDGDGVDEVLVVRWGGSSRPDSLLVFESDRRSGYRLAVALPLDPDPGIGSDTAIPRQIVTRPLERGRGTEIVLWSWMYGGGGSRLRLVHRCPDGTYRLIASLSGAGDEAKDMVLADFDGDDRGDVLIGEAESLGEAPLIGFRGSQDSGLEPMPRWFVGVPVSGLAAADFDGDRKPDLALVTGKAMSLHFFRNADAKWIRHPTRGVLPRPEARPLAADAPRVRATQVEFVLTRAGEASLAAYDITGRRVLERELGWRSAGEHAIELPELAALPAGVYWLRAGERGAGSVRKVVVMR